MKAPVFQGYRDWVKVQPEVAKFTRVCSYDRAGLAWSEPSTKPLTTQKIAEELHQLLTNANIQGPYVLVGHSLGAFHVRMFAALHPAEVIGMVLVDPTIEDGFDYRIQTYWDVAPPKELPSTKDPPEEKRTPEAEAVVSGPTQWRKTVNEENRAVGESIRQLRAAGRLPSIPLIVLTGGPKPPMGGTWGPGGTWGQPLNIKYWSTDSDPRHHAQWPCVCCPAGSRGTKPPSY